MYTGNDKWSWCYWKMGLYIYVISAFLNFLLSWLSFSRYQWRVLTTHFVSMKLSFHISHYNYCFIIVLYQHSIDLLLVWCLLLRNHLNLYCASNCPSKLDRFKMIISIFPFIRACWWLNKWILHGQSSILPRKNNQKIKRGTFEKNQLRPTSLNS